MEQKQIFDWIIRIIETCNNDFHFESVDKLIDLYHEKYQDENSKTELILSRQYKWNQIHSILQ